jgi:hypothetical protein
MARIGTNGLEGNLGREVMSRGHTGVLRRDKNGFYLDSESERHYLKSGDDFKYKHITVSSVQTFSRVVKLD